MNLPDSRSLCIIISAPSGAGKTTLCELLLKVFSGMRYSVSCTTRPPREGEQQGKDYIFLNESEFKQKINRTEFLEYAQVHGHWYGTLREEIEKSLSEGHDVLMDIDVQGASHIRQLILNGPASKLQNAFVDVFVVPPNFDVLRLRLEQRGKDSKKNIEKRLKTAHNEMKYLHDFKYVIVNNQLDEALDQLKCIIKAEHCRVQSASEH